MKFFTIIIVFLLLGITNVSGQIGPYAMVERMDRGINLGNTLSAPVEGNWAPEIYEQYFMDIKNAGFSNVRIPIDFYGARTIGTTTQYSIAANTSDDYNGTIDDYVVDHVSKLLTRVSNYSMIKLFV